MQDEDFVDLLWTQVELAATANKIGKDAIIRCVVSLAVATLYSEYDADGVRSYMEHVLGEWEEDEGPSVH